MKLEVISREPKVRSYEIPLLFVHGTGHAAWCWDENFLPYFAEKGFSAHALSLRGHGTSEGRNNLRWTSIADYVEDVSQVASSLPEMPIVIGHSMGGLVVQKYLEKHNAPAAVLVAPSPSEGMFCSGFLLPYKHPVLFAKIGLKRDYTVMFGTPKLAKKFLFSADADDEKIAGYVKRFGSESYRANLEMVFNLPKPSLIKTRMLVLGAENDALVSKRAILKTAKVYSADLKMFPGMAHDMMLEKNWKKVADHIIDWLHKNIE